MWEELEERVLCCAEYIVQTGCTVRACSAYFAVSKSTVHKDMIERLPYIDKVLYEEVREVLDRNLKERHIRGGNATRKKYETKRAKTLALRRDSSLNAKGKSTDNHGDVRQKY